MFNSRSHAITCLKKVYVKKFDEITKKVGLDWKFTFQKVDRLEIIKNLPKTYNKGTLYRILPELFKIICIVLIALYMHIYIYNFANS